MTEILRREKDRGESGSHTTHSADAFLEFFENKVKSVRSGTDGYPPAKVRAVANTQFLSFHACSADDVRRIIMKSPTKSCDLDPIPTFILKELLCTLLPFLTAMCNASILEGQLPQAQKHAIVTPLLKKSSLDPSDLKNYRPVSNLTFVSKIVEKLISEQLIAYLQSNDLMPRLQSAYRRHHSTETALLRVISDLLRAVDNRRVTLLGLLDLSAAFDCVDHEILLRRLNIAFGIDGLALQWIESFLTERTQQISYNGHLSSVGSLLCGVPQGSVLGPLFFLLYTAELFEVIAECGLVGHCYADDTQTYISVPAVDAASAVQQFAVCVGRIESWMGSNRLKLNAEKTQVIWIGSRQQLDKVDISELQLQSAIVQFTDTVSDLGVMVDSQLNMSAHVTAVSRSCMFQLRQLRAVSHSLSTDAAKTLVSAFIGSRLDYCNSLFAGVTSGLMTKLQSVQNAAARFISKSGKFDPVTPILRDLHWLPVRRRVDFKIATLVYKCLHGLAPPYLIDDCIPVSLLSGRQHLRSADTRKLFVPKTSTNYGSRSFAVFGPNLWNSLPTELRTIESVSIFRRKLKTHLFSL
jgi:hypothetical protein